MCQASHRRDDGLIEGGAEYCVAEGRIRVGYLVPISAILMPAGFFLSVLGANPQKPNRLIWLLWAGAISLTAGLLIAGIGLIVVGASALA